MSSAKCRQYFCFALSVLTNIIVYGNVWPSVRPFWPSTWVGHVGLECRMAFSCPANGAVWVHFSFDPADLRQPWPALLVKEASQTLWYMVTWNIIVWWSPCIYAKSKLCGHWSLIVWKKKRILWDKDKAAAFVANIIWVDSEKRIYIYIYIHIYVIGVSLGLLCIHSTLNPYNSSAKRVIVCITWLSGLWREMTSIFPSQRAELSYKC